MKEKYVNKDGDVLEPIKSVAISVRGVLAKIVIIYMLRV